MSGRTPGGLAGSRPGPISHLRPSQSIRWQSATVLRAVPPNVTSTLKSTQATTKSVPTLPLINPITGVAVMLSNGEPPEATPARASSPVTDVTPDQEPAVGPPGAAHSRMTARAPDPDADRIAAASILANCANAPTSVRPYPVATP